ncbi:MAG: radical SAM protein [Candidatus Omnitrophota bacterium]
MAGTCYPHVADVDLIRTYLKNNNWALSKKIKQANLIIITTCAFSEEAEGKSFEAIKRVQKEKNKAARVIVTGCLPSINNLKLRSVFDGVIISANSLREFNGLLNAKSMIGDVKYTGSPRYLKRNRNGTYRLRIGWGCSGKCSYCAVKFVFGKPYSRSISDILIEFNIACAKGYRKFILVANDAGSYGEDLGTSLPCLLRELCRRNRDCKFLLSHLTPSKLKEMLPSLKALVRSGKICQMNVPVESGSNRIIRLMNRSYTVDDFKYCIEKLTGYNSNLRLLTDVMVGFPSETEQDFLETSKLVEWLGRNNVVFHNLSYSPRPNTEASKLPGQIDQITKSVRLKKIARLSEISYLLRNKGLFGKIKRKRIF